MHPKDKINAATNAARDAAAAAQTAAQDAATAAQESFRASVHDAAATANEAAEHMKSYFSKLGKDKEHSHFHEHMHMPDQSNVSFFGLSYMAIIIAVVVVLLSALFIMRRRQGMRPLRRAMEWIMQKRGKYTVLICGPVDAGKTTLFNTLCGGKFQATQSSMEENVETFKIHPRILGEKKDKLCNIHFEFIDFPGHPSKELHLGKFFHRVNGVILLVDGTSNDSLINGSKTLFYLLEKKEFRNKKTPVLICANKTDLDSTQTLGSIRSRILEEIKKLKDSRSTMENTDKGDEDIMSIGKSGEPLTLENLGLTVSLGQICTKEGKITDVLDFLEGIQHQ